MCETCAGFINAIHGSNDDKAAKLRAETELELARIHRDEAIQLAKIQAKVATEEIAAEAIEAEVTAEVLSDVVEDLTAPEENTIVVTPSDDGGQVDEPLLDEEVAESPPEIDQAPSKPRERGYGNPFFFGG